MSIISHLSPPLELFNRAAVKFSSLVAIKIRLCYAMAFHVRQTVDDAFGIEQNTCLVVQGSGYPRPCQRQA
jgi:hypothetical protein